MGAGPYAKLAQMMRSPEDIARDEEYDRYYNRMNPADQRRMRKFTNKTDAVMYARRELNTVYTFFGSIKIRKYG